MISFQKNILEVLLPFIMFLLCLGKFGREKTINVEVLPNEIWLRSVTNKPTQGVFYRDSFFYG
ncbi:hypothetical protein GCM10026987_11410 [Belliella aquatica]|uniref:Uncharacterized protein n=1 Tax=Belliella aquatica TaxID=1323734 RepID=A0ABQ1M308_9BACT|nr:hypothetical protein GCM10010993_10510 [Belliella aquatica]